MKIIRCDRCSREFNQPLAELPVGWKKVEGSDLCNICLVALAEFLRRQPQADTVTAG